MQTEKDDTFLAACGLDIEKLLDKSKQDEYEKACLMIRLQGMRIKRKPALFLEAAGAPVSVDPYQYLTTNSNVSKYPSL